MSQLGSGCGHVSFLNVEYSKISTYLLSTVTFSQAPGVPPSDAGHRANVEHDDGDLRDC